MSVDGSTVVERPSAIPYRCDGVGSTAYNYWWGCRVTPGQCAPDFADLSPRAPASPVVLPLGARVEVEALSPERRPVRVVGDGQDLGPVVRMAVDASAPPVRLAFLGGHNFTETLISKVLQR